VVDVKMTMIGRYRSIQAYLFLHLSGRTEKNHRISQSGQSVPVVIKAPECIITALCVRWKRCLMMG